MVGIRSKIASLKANVVKRLFENQLNTLWNECFTQYLNCRYRKLVVPVRFDVKCLGTEIPTYWAGCRLSR